MSFHETKVAMSTFSIEKAPLLRLPYDLRHRIWTFLVPTTLEYHNNVIDLCTCEVEESTSEVLFGVATTKQAKGSAPFQLFHLANINRQIRDELTPILEGQLAITACCARSFEIWLDTFEGLPKTWIGSLTLTPHHSEKKKSKLRERKVMESEIVPVVFGSDAAMRRAEAFAADGGIRSVTFELEKNRGGLWLGRTAF